MITCVKLNITSVTIDPQEEERIISESPDGSDSPDTLGKISEAGERIDIVAYGGITNQDGQITVRYSGADGSFCTLSYLESEPEAVTVTRQGADGSYILFCSMRDPIVSCEYSIMGLSLPMTVITHSVRNTVKNKKGQIRLSYTLSARGVPMQKVRIAVKILPVSEEGKRRG